MYNINIKILQLIEGAKRAEGLTVIIDVFRAFSLACYLVDNGAEKIIPVGKIETAYRLKRENPDYILIGEREGKIQPGFDYGNSPSQIKNVNFTGKTVVHTTSAGTQGIRHAQKADKIITASFVNIDAVIEYIQTCNSAVVSLVCMGNEGKEPANEDTCCARYIKNALQSEGNNFKNIKNKLKEGSGRRFFDPQKDWSPQGDFDLCLDLNRFDFVLKVARNKKINELKKINITTDPKI